METPAAPRARAVDRLSELPDCVLEDILSRVTSRQAARTSVLSRRWRHVWHAVPSRCIDIDQSEFVRASTRPVATPFMDDARSYRRATVYGKSRCAEQDDHFKFMDFADHLTSMHACSPPLDAFCLRVTSRHEATLDMAHRWVRRALERRPETFELRYDNVVVRDREPDDFFPWRPPPPEFSFAHYHRSAAAVTCRLTTLRLSGLTLECDFAEVIEHDLPVLEDLRLEDCIYWFYRIVSRSLKALDIDNCGRCYYVHALVLKAPGIVSLRVHGGAPPLTSEDEMPSLVEVSLAHPAGKLGIVKYLRDATTLNLSGFSTDELLDDGDDFPVFKKLKALHLEECDVGVECQVLRRFLQKAPELERLTLLYCEFVGGSRSKKKKSRSSKMTSSSSNQCGPMAYECKNLKSVELEFYEQDEDVFQLDDALGDILREAVLPVESSVLYGKQKVKILYK